MDKTLSKIEAMRVENKSNFDSLRNENEAKYKKLHSLISSHAKKQEQNLSALKEDVKKEIAKSEVKLEAKYIKLNEEVMNIKTQLEGTTLPNPTELAETIQKAVETKVKEMWNSNPPPAAQDGNNLLIINDRLEELEKREKRNNITVSGLHVSPGKIREDIEAFLQRESSI